MIILFIRFLREIMRIPEEKMKPSIHLYPSTNKDKAVNFWSKITNLPKDQFKSTQQVSRASQGKKPYNLLPYGTLDLRVNSRQEFFRIRGWMDGLIDNKK